jgi:hypothetical protein
MYAALAFTTPAGSLKERRNYNQPMDMKTQYEIIVSEVRDSRPRKETADTKKGIQRKHDSDE